MMQWFQKLLSTFEMKKKFPPSQLRHIFVDERCSSDSSAGPSNKAAARIMGNSVERWEISYDKNVHQRSVEEGVKAMQQWREALKTLVD